MFKKSARPLAARMYVSNCLKLTILITLKNSLRDEKYSQSRIDESFRQRNNLSPSHCLFLLTPLPFFFPAENETQSKIEDPRYALYAFSTHELHQIAFQFLTKKCRLAVRVSSMFILGKIHRLVSDPHHSCSHTLICSAFS